MLSPIGRHVMLLDHPRHVASAASRPSTDDVETAGHPNGDVATPAHHEHHLHVVSHATGKRHVLHDVLDLLGLVLVGLIAWVLWPASLGGSTHIIVVQGHSMEPVFHLGDAIVVKDNHDPQVGDIIVFKIPNDEPGAGSLVVHRIIGFRTDGTIVTRGDNRTIEDPFHVRPSDVVGTPSWTLPHVGRMIGLASSPYVVGGAIGLLSLLMLLPGKEDEDEDEAHEGDAAANAGDGPPPRIADPAKVERRRKAMAELVPRRGRRLAVHPDHVPMGQPSVQVPMTSDPSAEPGADPGALPPNISPAVAARVRSLSEPATLEVPALDLDELDDVLSRLGPDA